MTNVVRFPVERRARPTLELLRDLAPDVREVLGVAEAFGLVAPALDFRDRVDAATAEHIATQIPPAGPVRTRMLAALLDPVITAGVAACHAAHDASLVAAEAREALSRAPTARQFWLDPLREHAAVLSQRAAECLILAHLHAEEAHGVARAVRMARDGEVWAPRDTHAEADALFGVTRAAR